MSTGWRTRLATQARRKRVLLISDSALYPLVIGGMEIRARELVVELQRRLEIGVLTGADVTLPDGTCRPLNLLNRQPKTVVDFVRQRVSWAAGTLMFAVSGCRALRALLAEYQPDLVYLHKFHNFPQFVLHQLITSGVPVVARFGDHHGHALTGVLNGTWRDELDRQLGFLRTIPLGLHAHREAIHDLVTLVFNCHALDRFYRSSFDDRIRRIVISNGVDTTVFRPAGCRSSGARFVFLGRTIREKGYIDFCRAMVELPRDIISNINVIGDGADLDEGIAILREGGRSDLLGHIGRASQEAVPTLLRTSSILVHPSHDEGLPAAVMEGLACGLGVIASDVGGTSEVVHDGETGIIVPSANLDSLVDACRRMATNEDLRHRLGRNGRRVVVAAHDRSRWLGGMEHLMSSLMDRPARTVA